MKENLPNPHIQKDEAVHAILTGVLIGVGLGSVIAINTPILLGSGITVLGIHETKVAFEKINKRKVIKIWAGKGNRTPMSTLAMSRSTTKLYPHI